MEEKSSITTVVIVLRVVTVVEILSADCKILIIQESNCEFLLSKKYKKTLNFGDSSF